jgi:hypothetical protein
MTSIARLLSVLLVFCTTVGAVAQTPPPTKVPQPDGTIQLVPVPPGFVYTPYYIDPSIKYRLYLTSNWANKSWNSGTKNGTTAFKGDVIDATIMAMPLTPPPMDLIVRDKPMKVMKWSIYRSTDVIVQYDHTRLELIPYNPAANGFGFDPAVMDASKTKYTVLGDGVVMFHGEALKAPELRTPALKPMYYQWNFDGYMWQGAYRMLGRMQFRVKDDYYLPSWGAQQAFIRIVPSIKIGEVEHKSKVDGSPTIGTDVLSEIRTEGEAIQFGAPPTYKVAHYLTAATTPYKVGDTVPVQIKVKPESMPQILYYVATNFAWDNTKLEFMGISNTGARRAQSSRMDMPGAGSINESPVPKDGNAFHNWLSQLGDRSYLTGEALIVTLNFKVISDFTTTQVEIIKQADPRIAGLWVPEESTVGGSNLPGSVVLGTQTPSVTINGILPN